MTAVAHPAFDSLASLYALRERVQRRLEDAAPYSPDWAAASEHGEELDQEIAAQLARSNESAQG